MATRVARLAVVPALFVGFLASAASVQAADQFQSPCTLPFAAIAEEREIDGTCGSAGDAASGPHAAQNRAKNNFCATGLPIPVAYTTFKALQRAVDKATNIPYGSANKLPPDRDALKNLVKLPNGTLIGEGTIVQYVAFISHPRNSNVTKGESVNCKASGADNNDIHFDLLRRPNDGEPACRSITAEISPHYRPDAWQVPKLRRLRDHPVRITGPLFFDAAHRPCQGDTDTVNPKRISVWEIHPVYAIDICRGQTLAVCRAANPTPWVPLDRWFSRDDDDDASGK